MDRHEKLMREAIELAKQGEPSPNPHVGCVIAAGDTIVGRGHHEAAGMDHAEAVALAEAGTRAKGNALYVTLEPCNHQGRTPPCVDGIISAGIKEVYVGCRDPNPAVTGGGIERLEAAGIKVHTGILEREAQQVIKAWSKFITQDTSYLSLKLALSLDGRIATRSGDSKWLTGEAARGRVHQLRAQHDAVMVGINTVLADDPNLTIHEAQGTNPARVIVDSKLRIPLTCKLVKTATHAATCVITTREASESDVQALEAKHVNVIRVTAMSDGRCDMRAALRELAKREVVSVICEGGAELAGSLLANQLADELHAFVAPVLLGPRGRPGAVDWAGPETLNLAPYVEDAKWELCGKDAYVSGRLLYPEEE